mgnify:CR=1 FL=1
MDRGERIAKRIDYIISLVITITMLVAGPFVL